MEEADIKRLENAEKMAKEVMKFLKGPVGRLLIFRMNEEMDRIKDTLVKTSPAEPYTIAKLQGKYDALKHIDNILAEAILDGKNATEVLNDLVE